MLHIDRLGNRFLRHGLFLLGAP